MKKLTLAIALLFAIVPRVHAQLYQGVLSSDPCALYPHLSAQIPVAATPTAALISGQASKQIFVCGFHFTMAGASPTLIFSSGSVGAATPCATGTASEKMTSFTEGGGGAGSLAGAGNSFDNSGGPGNVTILGPIPPVPTATALTYDLCVQTLTTGTVGGFVSYVIH